MYNNYLETYFNQYMAISDTKKSKLVKKNDLVNLCLVEVYNYDDWFKNEEFANKKEEPTEYILSDMPPLEGDKEEVKKEKY